MSNSPKDKFNPQYALLSRLRFETLPLSFSDPTDIGDLQVLHAASLLECTFPAVQWVRGEKHYEGAAVVHRLTPLGRAQAGRFSAQARNRDAGRATATDARSLDRSAK